MMAFKGVYGKLRRLALHFSEVLVEPLDVR